MLASIDGMVPMLMSSSSSPVLDSGELRGRTLTSL